MPYGTALAMLEGVVELFGELPLLSVFVLEEGGPFFWRLPPFPSLLLP